MALGIIVLEDQTLESGTTTAAATTEYATNPINAAAGEKFQNVTIVSSIDFKTGGDDANIHFRKSADGGTVKPNTKTYVATVAFDTSATQITSFQFNDFTYGEFGVENTDAGTELEWAAKFEGLKITGAV